ncbi:hypothetical protein [Dysgonomonas gadei]|uniref:hypothetical protein n=1 Tax=Dysgonomonas gadei TaxID=156974 RepID=UPI003AEFAC20
MKYASARAVSFKDGVPVGLKDEKTETCLSLSTNSGYTIFPASFSVSSFCPLRVGL